MSPRSPHALLLALVVLAPACGDPARNAFSVHYPDNEPEAIQALFQRLAVAPAQSPQSSAVGVTPAPQRLFVYDLATQRLRWQQPCSPRYRPLLAGSTVLTQEADGIVGRDLASGRTVFALPDQRRTLIGADGEGDSLVFTLSSGGTSRAHSTVVAVRAGNVAWRRQLDAPAGAPALVGDVVLVPWSTQFISALHSITGTEFARLRVTDDVVGHVFRDGQHIYAGQSNLFRVSAALASGLASKAGRYTPVRRVTLPGSPGLLPPVYADLESRALKSATHRIRLSLRPTVREMRVHPEGDRLYLTFYRVALALDASSYAVQWARLLPRDVVGARAVRTGLLIADQQGTLTLLDAAGGEQLWTAQAGVPSLVTQLYVSQPPSARVANHAPGDGLDAIVEVIGDHDARLVPVQLLVAKGLAKMPGPLVTKRLIGLCDDRLLAKGVRGAACSALAARKNGKDHVLAALGRYANYLTKTRPPPVKSLALAAKTMNLGAAAPMLIEHLNDPATPADALATIVTSLAALGGPGAVPSLTRFLRAYHADSADEHLVQAVGAAAKALATIQGEQARPLLEKIANDALTTPGVDERIRLALDLLDAGRQAKQQREREGEIARGDPDQTQSLSPQSLSPQSSRSSDVPDRLTPDVVEQTLGPVKRQMRACLRTVDPPQYFARLVLVVEDGLLMSVSVVPESLRSCIEPLVRAQTFPVTRSMKREHVTYNVRF
ncbi:MAG: PQQ-like beta-propeller repeat protein [Proteobacteria bacterium]|nr:PQQ-like beta-propeller repeat protein [Pseudomonadota bacterium]